MVRFDWRRARAVVAAASFLISGVSLALAQAAPAAKATAPSFNFPKAISEARTTWTKDSSRIAQLLSTLKSEAASVSRLEPEIRSLIDEAKALERDKERALDELRSGMFCDGCNKTRSQILAAGERFPHPGQKSIPASPEQIAAAEKEFDQKIDRLRRRLTRLQDERKEAQAALDSAMHELNSLIYHYHKDMMAEARLRQDQWGQERKTLEQSLDTLHQNVIAAEESAKTAKGPAIQATQTNLRILQKQFTDTLQRAQAAEARTRQESTTFSATVKADMEHLRQLALDVPQQFGLPGGWHLGHRISTPALPIAYSVSGFRHYEPIAMDRKIRDLLEGTVKASSSPEKTPPAKSMKDLLEGR